MSPLSTLIRVVLSLKSANKLSKHLTVSACGFCSVPFCLCGFFLEQATRFISQFYTNVPGMLCHLSFFVVVAISLTVGNICCLIYRHRSMLQLPIE